MVMMCGTGQACLTSVLPPPPRGAATRTLCYNYRVTNGGGLPLQTRSVWFATGRASGCKTASPNPPICPFMLKWRKGIWGKPANPEDAAEQKELGAIYERYKNALKVFVEHRFPQQPSRFAELLAQIPEVRNAATLVVQSKMFYVPLLLNTCLSK